MSGLDQAFIKAYTRHDATSAPVPPANVSVVPLAAALPESPPREATRPPADVSLDGVMEALQRMPAGFAGTEALESKAALEQDQQASGDETHTQTTEPCPDAKSPSDAESELPPFVRRETGQAASHEAATAPTLEPVTPQGLVHRVDPPAGDEQPPETNAETAPAPHLNMTIFGASQDTGIPPEGGVATNARSATNEETSACQGTTDKTVDMRFHPMLQVDRFSWPKACRRLGRVAAEELDHLAEAVVQALAEGRKVLAIGGCGSSDGVTTMVLCAGRQLAAQGYKVVMVDANPADPKLAKRLGIMARHGWEDVLLGRLPLGEVVVEFDDGRLALLPLVEALADTNRPDEYETRLGESLDTLAAHYDLVLIDLGSLADPEMASGSLARGIARRLDAIAVVQDVRTSQRERLAEVQRCLAATDIAQVGIIENFVGT